MDDCKKRNQILLRYYKYPKHFGILHFFFLFPLHITFSLFKIAVFRNTYKLNTGTVNKIALVQCTEMHL